MKNNRKNRKLEYIREKNYLRKFNPLRLYSKISNSMLKNINAQDLEESLSLPFYEEKYKLKFSVTKIFVGFEGNDFINDLKTIRYTIQRSK